VAGDPAAQKDVTTIVQAAEKGDPAAKSTYEVIAQVLLDKAQHSEWGQRLWERIMGSNSAAVRAGGYPSRVGNFNGQYGWYPVHGAYSSPVAVGSFWDSLGSGALSVYRTVSTPVTWFHKKVNQTLEDNPALKQLVVTAASSVASAYGGPAAGKAVSEFGPAIITSSAV